jgi:hypothetical protein
MEGNGAKSMRFALGTIYHRLRSLGAKAKHAKFLSSRWGLTVFVDGSAITAATCPTKREGTSRAVADRVGEVGSRDSGEPRAKPYKR